VLDAALHLSVLTLGERLLPINAAVADRWGRLFDQAARPMPAIECLIAATAIHHGLRILDNQLSCPENHHNHAAR
jgi:predicted nucleic acid-binding protein